MPFEIRHNTIEHWEKPCLASTGLGIKSSINLNNDVPLAMDRQFADQWALTQKNRNPRLDEPIMINR